MFYRYPAVKHNALCWSLGALALIAVGAPSLAVAQTDIGLYFGPNFSGMSGSYIESSTYRRGFAGGLFVERHLHRHWSVEVAVNFTQKGAFEVQAPGADSLVDYRFTYLQAPVTGHYLLPLSDSWTLGFFGGGALALGMGCEVKPSTQFEFEDECSATRPGGELEDFDLVVLFGVEIRRVYGGGSRWGFDLRYSMGTRNVLTGAEAAGLSARNNVLDILFRIALPIAGPS
jgi:hypothetical protein